MSVRSPITVWSLILCGVLLAAPVLAGDLAPGAWGDAGIVLQSPFAIASSGSRVFVADFDGDRIRVLGTGGETLADWGATGVEPGQLLGPAAVAVAPDGSLAVADLYNHRIQRFAPDGRLLAAWSLGEEAAPFGIAADARGRLYVTDLDAARVTVWSPEGGLIAGWGTRGSAPGELREPWGIAVDAGGDVWIADHGNDRIQRFTSAGEWLDAWGEAGLGEGQMLGPIAIAIGRDGSLAVTDLVGGRVRGFDRSGRVVARWETAHAASPGVMTGVALDESSNLLVVDPSRARIERIAAAPIVAAESTPTAFELMPIAPFRGQGAVTLELAIPGAGTIAAGIYALDGRRVHAVPRRGCAAGVLRLTWDGTTGDGRRAPTGMYFVRAYFEDGTHSATRTGRVIVLR